MRKFLVKTVAAASLAGVSLAAQACGYTGGAGIEGMFSLDDPLDILILAVLVGGVCAFIPALRKSSDTPKRVAG